MTKPPEKDKKHANASRILQDAIQFHQQGRFDQAEALYLQSLASQPSQFEARYLIAVLRTQQNRNAEACDDFTAALKLDPTNVAALLSLGIVLARLNRCDEALAAYDHALAIKPDFNEVHFYRGNALLHLNRSLESLASYDSALAHKPGHVEALLNRGNTLQNLNRPEEALASYDKALALKPDYAQAHSNRGNVLRKQGKLTEARSSYRRALQLDPDYVEIEGDLGIIERHGMRSLHLGAPNAQSRMRIDQPFELVQSHQRGLMAFLLFKRQAREVLAIGLGGGSIPKFIWRNLPGMRTRAVEISPHVISVARSHFHLPEDDAQLQVIVGDGAQFLRQYPATADVVILDAYDTMGVPEGLYSQDFFDRCFDALITDGLLAVHLWNTDKNFETYVQRIERSFSHRVLRLPIDQSTSVVVFAFRDTPGDLRWSSLRENAKTLEAIHGVEFATFVDRLRVSNPETNNGLTVRP